MPRSVVRYFSAKDSITLEKKLDQFAADNPQWEIISVSHQLIPAGISVVLVIKHTNTMGVKPPSAIK